MKRFKQYLALGLAILITSTEVFATQEIPQVNATEMTAEIVESSQTTESAEIVEVEEAEKVESSTELKESQSEKEVEETAETEKMNPVYWTTNGLLYIIIRQTNPSEFSKSVVLPINNAKSDNTNIPTALCVEIEFPVIYEYDITIETEIHIANQMLLRHFLKAR